MITNHNIVELEWIQVKKYSPYQGMFQKFVSDTMWYELELDQDDFEKEWNVVIEFWKSTEDTRSNGEVLFKGHVDTIEELQLILKCVMVYDESTGEL